MPSTIIAINQTGLPITLTQLSTTIPASASVTLSDFNFEFEIWADVQLEGEIASGNVLLTVDGVDFDQASSLLAFRSVRASSTQVFNAYDSSGNQNFTGTTTININATRIADSIYTLNSDQVSVDADGTYEVEGRVTLKSSGGNRTQADSWLELNSTEIPGTRGTQYLRQNAYGATASLKAIIDLTSGDVLRLRAQRVTGSGTLRVVANASSLIIKKVR